MTSKELFQYFDSIVENLKAHDLYEGAELEQTDTIFASSYTDSWNNSISHSIRGIGSPKKKLSKEGDKLSLYPKLFKVSDGKETTLTHREGEILFLLVWSLFPGSYGTQMYSIKEMLEKHQEEWKDKVRIVTICIDNDIQKMRQVVNLHNWNSFEHLTSLGQNCQNYYLMRFDSIKTPFIVFVDKNENIDYFGETHFVSFQQKINNLINNIRSKEPEILTGTQQQELLENSDEDPDRVTEASFNTIRQNIKTIQQQITGVPGPYFQLIVKKQLKNNKISMLYNKVHFYFKGTVQHYEVRDKILSILYKNVPKAHILNYSYIVDPPRAFKDQKAFILNLAKQFNAPPPYLAQFYSHKPFSYSGWSQLQSCTFPSYILGKDISRSQFCKLRYEVRQFFNNMSQDQRSNKMKIILQDGMPISIVGNPFCGFQNLINTKTKEEVTSEFSQKRVDIIAFYHGPEQSQAFIERLIEYVKALSGKVHLHLINIRQNLFQNVKKLQDENPDIMTVYSDKSQIQIISVFFYQQTYLLVVNEEGIVTHCGEYFGNDFGELISKQPENVSQSSQFVLEGNPLDDLNAIINGEDVKSLVQIVKSWDYQPQFQISFEQNHDIQMFTKPIVKLAYRRSDEKAFQNIIAAFEKVAKVTKSIVEIFQIPQGKTCVDCNCELKLPYYYYYFSSTFRCIECAEKYNLTTENLLDVCCVKETGIVIFKQNTSVDIKRLGNNIQPKNIDQVCRKWYTCNGCGTGQSTIPRYICTGCWREPNFAAEVDFCFECAMTLIGDDDQDGKKLILKRTLKDGHRDWHALLKITFSVKGYYGY